MSEDFSINFHDWKTWLKENSPRFLLCARQWTNSLADAEDVLQEAFIRFWKHQRHLPGNPSALIITSIRRTAIDLGRSRIRRINREHQSYELGDKTTLFEPGKDDQALSIDRALKALPEKQREVIVLKIWGDLTFDEIAQQLNISLNTAASRYRYALNTLKGIIKE